jgi:sigma-B regulation protein RsbU (phosphoserine phosphatase)
MVTTEFSECKVLVVDDSQRNLDFVTLLLSIAGIQKVTCALDGLEALEAIETFDPDIVVLDIMMPRMDGYEFLRRFRAIPRMADVPVLVVTALDDHEQRAKAFDLGGSDYVVKPIERREFIARLSVHLRNRQLIGRLRNYQDRLQFDLEIARSMQRGLLPAQDRVATLEKTYGITIGSVFRTAYEVGGDLWGAFPLDADRFGLWLADFSGHGVAAAINTFRLHVMLRESANAGDPGQLLADLNGTLKAVLPRGQFATMVYAVCDMRAHKLTFSTAGHPAPILKSSVGTVQSYPMASPPLGIAQGTKYRTIDLPFGPGTSLFIYSDGLSEAEAAQGAVGEEGAMALAEGLPAPADLPAAIARLLGPDQAPEDDLTAVWVSRG